jgi:hypothetical protein
MPTCWSRVCTEAGIEDLLSFITPLAHYLIQDSIYFPYYQGSCETQTFTAPPDDYRLWFAHVTCSPFRLLYIRCHVFTFVALIPTSLSIARMPFLYSA